MNRVEPVRTVRLRRRDESGASLVEFALVLPVFMMLLLGMFTGGITYSRKLSITQASREGARYGATLPLPASLDAWLTQVSSVVVASGDGELASDTPGQTVCVAYISSSGIARKRQQVGTAVNFSDSTCIAADGRNEARVQVVAGRTSKFEALVFSRDIDLRSSAVARFESP